MSFIFDLLLVMVGIVIILVSTKRGFIKNLARSLRWILALILTYALGGRASAFLNDVMIGPAVRGFMHGKVTELYEDAAGAIDQEALLKELPAFLRTEELAERLPSGGGKEEWIDSVTETLSLPVASFLSNVFAYVLVFLLSLILLWFAVKLLDGIVNQIKPLGHINTILGFVWGFLIAWVLWLSVASVFRVFFADSQIYTDSTVLRFFGETAQKGFFRVFDVGGMLLSNLLD